MNGLARRASSLILEEAMDHKSVFRAIAALAMACMGDSPSRYSADETCNSPYIAKLIKGQEDYVYVWTLGVEGLETAPTSLVTVDVNRSQRATARSSTRSPPVAAGRGASHGIYRRPPPHLAGGF